MISLCRFYATRFTGCRSSNELSWKLQCLPSTVSEVPALRTSAAFAPHSLKLVEEWGFVLRTAGTYACHLRGQNLANACAVSALLHPEHGTLYRYISVRQPSADNSASLGSKLISSNAPTYHFYLWELLRSELTYLLTYYRLNSEICHYERYGNWNYYCTLLNNHFLRFSSEWVNSAAVDVDCRHM